MITIEISTTNAAFQGLNHDREVARILRKLAEKFEAGDDPLIILDLNGNRVGHVEYS